MKVKAALNIIQWTLKQLLNDGHFPRTIWFWWNSNKYKSRCGEWRDCPEKESGPEGNALVRDSAGVWFRCLNIYTPKPSLQPGTWWSTEPLMLVCCVVAFILVTCSLSPGSHSSSLWILQTALPTRYEVVRNWSINPTLAVDYFHMLIMIHGSLSTLPCDGCVSDKMKNWRNHDKTHDVCTYTRLHISNVCHVPVIWLWYACDAGLWQTRWYVLWGCWILLSLSTSVRLCCLTEFHQSFRPTSCVSAVSHHLSQGCAR